mmetsp:Transcript_49189/g.91132  ORF Transcript_49189/g.91132 Transcript_49189/m.91132 type:complete len:91 (+) Transcript_49189:968-1240(+)
MTPDAVAKGMPALQSASEAVTDKILASDRVVMEDMCNELTLDVAWRQIIGLDLKDDAEIEEFRTATAAWIRGIVNPFMPLLHCLILLSRE